MYKKNISLIFFLIFLVNRIQPAVTMEGISNVVLNDFNPESKNELIELSEPPKEYVKFLEGHLFKNIETNRNWYSDGIKDLYDKVQKNEISANSIVANGKVVGVMWLTDVQCDIFIHPTYNGNKYGSKAMSLFFNNHSSTSVGISVNNIPCLKSFARVLKSKNATDNLGYNLQITHDDLLHIVEITTKKQKENMKDINEIIDEVMRENKNKIELFKAFFAIESVQMTIS